MRWSSCASRLESLTFPAFPNAPNRIGSCVKGRISPLWRLSVVSHGAGKTDPSQQGASLRRRKERVTVCLGSWNLPFRPLLQTEPGRRNTRMPQERVSSRGARPSPICFPSSEVGSHLPLEYALFWSISSKQYSSNHLLPGLILFPRYF